MAIEVLHRVSHICYRFGRKAFLMNSNNREIHNQADILIAGGGYVGLSCATAIKASAPHLDIVVVDPASDAQIENDERSSAVAADASRMLDALGLWDELVANAQPINEMIVTDSKVADITRPVFLTFANDREQDEPFAHMVENRELVKALRKKADKLGVLRMEQESVSGFEEESALTRITLSSGAELSARCARLRAGGVPWHLDHPSRVFTCRQAHRGDQAG